MQQAKIDASSILAQKAESVVFSLGANPELGGRLAPYYLAVTDRTAD
jgi:hypothetical protein